MKFGFFVLFIWSLAVAGGCNEQKDANTKPTKQRAPAVDEDRIPFPEVTDLAKNLLYSYVGESGRMISVAQIQDVPEKARERVLVVDLEKSPEERMAHRYAFFADLTTKSEDGSYAVTVASRYQSAKGEGPPAGILPANNADVIVYSAVWCGFCRKLEKWLDDRGTPYLKRDVEKDPGADRELKAKLAKAGISSGGIPVTDVAGSMVVGFNKPKLTKLIDQLANKAPSK